MLAVAQQAEDLATGWIGNRPENRLAPLWIGDSHIRHNA
jgi:hypothetical protein